MLLVATCLPYFALYTRDLRLVGRRRRDLLEVYALNLLLLPVNLGGVVKSVHQAVTGNRIPFGRAPKVSDRTAAPALYVAVTLLFLAEWSTGAGIDADSGRITHAVLGGLNAVILALAITRYMGWRNAAADLTAPARVRLQHRFTTANTANTAEVKAAPETNPPEALPHPASTGASTRSTPSFPRSSTPGGTNTHPGRAAPTAAKYHLARHDHQRSR